MLSVHMGCWVFIWDIEYSCGMSHSYGMFCFLESFICDVECSHGMLSLYMGCWRFIWDESFIWDVLFVWVIHMWCWVYTWDFKYSHGMLSIYMGCWSIHMGWVIHMGCFVSWSHSYVMLSVHMGCWVFIWFVGVFIWDESLIWDVLFVWVIHMWCWVFTWDVEYLYGMLEYSYGMLDDSYGMSHSYGMFDSCSHLWEVEYSYGKWLKMCECRSLTHTLHGRNSSKKSAHKTLCVLYLAARSFLRICTYGVATISRLL